MNHGSTTAVIHDTKKKST